MRLICLTLISIALGSASPNDDSSYFYNNGVDFMSLTLRENNKYELIISSCTFKVRCQGRYKSFGDSLVIINKKIEQNIDRPENSKWRKTASSRRVKNKYLKEFRYLLVKDSTLIANQLRWTNLVFKKRNSIQ